MELDEIIPKQPSNKRLSVERIYQKKTQLEHILLRPDTYIGSVEPVTQTMWVWDEGKGMVNREITFVPGLYKIFDEILVNAADNKQRDKKMSAIKIEIDPEKNRIAVWNDGKGIPVVEHKGEKMYVPEMIFGHLLTSSNYNDDDKKVTGGRNGYGAKLCNIFSTKFTVETSSKDERKRFKQSWSDNMSKAHEKKIVPSDKPDFTCITFHPDLPKFHMTALDKDIVALLSRRAYDIAGSTAGVKVYLNGERLPVKTFKDYVQLYVGQMRDEEGQPLRIVHEQVNPRWEICLTSSEKGFQQISFVNSIATTKGGRHIDYVTEQITKKLIEVVKRKNKGGVEVKPFQIKNHCFVFVNCLIENPTFDSQTKENMTLQAKKFGSKCELTDKFLKSAGSSGIVDQVMNWVKFKAQSQLKNKSAGKTSKLKGIPKLDDANDAGTKHSLNCTLILTEGDSAKTLAVSGLSVVGRDKYGVFPLRGKLLNVRDASHKQIMENAEITNIVKILGLKYGKKYEEDDELKTLRYGKLMIMTDQDHDGSHIKGLIINFIHSNWPNMLQRRMLEEFITPIVKVTKGSQELAFYTIPEFEEWQTNIPNPKSWKVKYYKGLGTSTSKEAKSYFADMIRHRVRFKYSGPQDDESIDMAFNKKRADDRKEWLTGFMDERRRCREDERPEPGSTLYSADTRTLTFNDFVNKELVMFSCADLERSVPSLVDGLKPGQRKVLYTCLKRNDKREIKVAQLSGSVAEMSAYHHGEVSLQSTIINMAQNYVGSNNLNLLQPIGQFGTRLHGGKDAASPRYIFTMLSPLTRMLFPKVDDNLLTWMYDDNQRVEPYWYCPIIPMVLVNGTEGIGTGWSTRVPNHDVREVVENCRRFIRDEELVPMKANYKNFRGTIEEVENNKYVIFGEVALIDDNTVEITELPIRTWTQNYKESVLEPLVLGTDKVPAQAQEYKEYNTDSTVRFLVKMTAEKLRDAENKGLHKFFSLQNSLCVNNTLVMFDEMGVLKRFNNTTDIIKHFCTIRLRLYVERKDFLMGLLTAEAKKLSNQARFILEKIEGKISIFNKKRKVLLDLLQERGYDSDPVKAWEKTIKQKLAEKDSQEEDVAEDNEDDLPDDRNYNYILNMPLWSLSRERKDDLLAQRDKKKAELEDLRRKTPKDLWNIDLDAFIEELKKVEEKERSDALTPAEGGGATKSNKKQATIFGAKQRSGKMKEVQEVKPSAHAIRVDPVIDPALMARLKQVGVERKGSRKAKKEVDNNKKMDSFVKKEQVDFDNMDAEKPPSLMARIHNSAEKKKKLVKKAPATSGKTLKQSKIEFKAKPGKKKKNPWESDSNSSDDEAVATIKDGSDEEEEVLPARNKSARSTARSTKKYNYNSGSSSDDEMETNAKPKTNGNGNSAASEDGGDVIDDSSSDDFKAAPPSGKSKAVSKSKENGKPAPKRNMVYSDDDDEYVIKSSDEDEAPTLMSKLKATAAEKRKQSDSKQPPAKISKVAATTKKSAIKQTKIDDDDDDDDDDVINIGDDSDDDDYSGGDSGKGKKAAKPAPKKKPSVKRPAAAPKTAKKPSTSAKSATSKPKPKGRKNMMDSSDEDEFRIDDSGDGNAPTARVRGGRERKTQAKYTFDDDSDDDGDDDY